jgi:hypothetical protein
LAKGKKTFKDHKEVIEQIALLQTEGERKRRFKVFKNIKNAFIYFAIILTSWILLYVGF